MPDALSPQVPIIEDVLDALGVARRRRRGYEADDVIGTLATLTTAGAVDVVTGDRDLFQLVDDARAVRILYIGARRRPPRAVDEAAVDGQVRHPRPRLRRLRHAARRPSRRSARGGGRRRQDRGAR